MRIGSSKSPKVWEIWIANVKFDGGTGQKIRPVLILSVNGSKYEVGEMTSRPHLENNPILINDQVSTGLDRGSYLKSDRTGTLHQSDFRDKMGYLPPEYRQMVQRAFGKR